MSREEREVLILAPCARLPCGENIAAEHKDAERSRVHALTQTHNTYADTTITSHSVVENEPEDKSSLHFKEKTTAELLVFFVLEKCCANASAVTQFRPAFPVK